MKKKILFAGFACILATNFPGGYAVRAPEPIYAAMEPAAVCDRQPSENCIEKEPGEAEEIFQSIGTFRITGYTSDPSENAGYTVTCLGDDLESNIGKIVAVDKRVIPLNTKLYIEGIGYRTARDTGVTGRTIDVLTDCNAESLAITGDYEVYIVK